MLIQTPEKFIRPFLLYGGLTFTIIRRAVTVGMFLLFIHLFIATIVPVRGDSMAPTLPNGTYILVDQISPRLRSLSRGEIVAFRYPVDQSQKFIKRIIGEPYDILEIADGDVLLTRSENKEQIKLREPYLMIGTQTKGSISSAVGPVEYFLMGDNRTVSLDSRIFGPVSKELMLGRALMVVWPLSEIRLVSHFDPVDASR